MTSRPEEILNDICNSITVLSEQSVAATQIFDGSDVILLAEGKHDDNQSQISSSDIVNALNNAISLGKTARDIDIRNNMLKVNEVTIKHLKLLNNSAEKLMKILVRTCSTACSIKMGAAKKYNDFSALIHSYIKKFLKLKPLVKAILNVREIKEAIEDEIVTYENLSLLLVCRTACELAIHQYQYASKGKSFEEECRGSSNDTSNSILLSLPTLVNWISICDETIFETLEKKRCSRNLEVHEIEDLPRFIYRDQSRTDLADVTSAYLILRTQILNSIFSVELYPEEIFLPSLFGVENIFTQSVTKKNQNTNQNEKTPVIDTTNQAVLVYKLASSMMPGRETQDVYMKAIIIHEVDSESSTFYRARRILIRIKLYLFLLNGKDDEFNALRHLLYEITSKDNSKEDRSHIKADVVASGDGVNFIPYSKIEWLNYIFNKITTLPKLKELFENTPSIKDLFKISPDSMLLTNTSSEQIFQRLFQARRKVINHPRFTSWYILSIHLLLVHSKIGGDDAILLQEFSYIYGEEYFDFKRRNSSTHDSFSSTSSVIIEYRSIIEELLMNSHENNNSVSNVLLSIAVYDSILLLIELQPQDDDDVSKLTEVLSTGISIASKTQLRPYLEVLLAVIRHILTPSLELLGSNLVRENNSASSGTNKSDGEINSMTHVEAFRLCELLLPVLEVVDLERFQHRAAFVAFESVASWLVDVFKGADSLMLLRRLSCLINELKEKYVLSYEILGLDYVLFIEIFDQIIYILRGRLKSRSDKIDEREDAKRLISYDGLLLPMEILYEKDGFVLNRSDSFGTHQVPSLVKELSYIDNYELMHWVGFTEDC